jgi:hypothetical protein
MAHCKLGHAMTPENTRIRSKKGKWKYSCCRKCDKIHRQRHIQKLQSGAPSLSKNKEDKIIAALRSGALVSEIVRGQRYDGAKRRKIYLPGKQICQAENFYAHQRAFPSFRTLVEEAKAEGHRRTYIINPAPLAKVRGIVNTQSWLDKEAMPMIERCVYQITPHLRDDVRNSLVALVWSGEIQIDDIPHAAKKLVNKETGGYDLATSGYRNGVIHTSIYDIGFDGSPKIDSISQGIWD